jgi:phosphate transport system substrate-binding protein
MPEYQKQENIRGNLSSIGSDTLANLLTLWGEAFERLYPTVNIQVQAAGSSTAPPALTEGTASLGPMSRAMKNKEIEAFRSRHGYKPTAIRVAIDALAVYVHRDNPIPSLSIPELDGIFSTTHRCPGSNDLTRWGQLDLRGTWQTRPIQPYGRNSVSGTYGYFKQIALCSGDFRATVNEQPGSGSVVQAVASTLGGIGYSGIGYKTSGVRSVPIARGPGDEPVEASTKTALSGAYPFARYFYIYVNKRPGSPLPRLPREFLKLVLSREGQDLVRRDGYIPLSAQLVTEELSKLQ